MTQLVTSGDSIKIWETPGYDCLHEWFSSTPNSGGILVLFNISIPTCSDCRYSWNSWSVDHGCVATAVKGRDKVVLTYSKQDKYSSQEIQLQGISSPSVIRFPRTTQKNLFVSSDNTVHLYDLSRQKVSKSFKLKSRVTSFVLNNCDAYLAAGCEDGSLQLVTVGTNQTSQPLLAAKCSGQRISALQYSSFKVSTKSDQTRLEFWIFHDVPSSRLSWPPAVRAESSLSGTATPTRTSSASAPIWLRPRTSPSVLSTPTSCSQWGWTRSWCVATPPPGRS